MIREIDEVVFELDYNESDSESNVFVKEEEILGKIFKELKDKVMEKLKESLDIVVVS